MVSKIWGIEFENIDFKDFIRLTISVFLIGGLMLIIIFSIFKNNFEFPLKITEIFSGWIVAVILFFFQQKEIEEKSKQIEIKTSKSLQVGDVVERLSKSPDETIEKLKDYLSQSHPDLLEELYAKKQIT